MYLTALLCSVVLLLCNAKDPTDQLNVEKIAEFKAAFLCFAGKEDGYFTIQELKTKKQWLAVKEREADDLEAMMEAAYPDGGGDYYNNRSIDLSKFLDMMASEGQLNDTQIAEYEEAFLEFADEDGKITTQNLKTIMQGLVETMTEPANLEDMMEAAAFPGGGDYYNNRSIDFSKFLDMMALPQKADQLNDTQIAEYKEAFSWFAGKEDSITTQELKTKMQWLVKKKTEADYLEAMMEAAAFPGGYDDGKIDFPKFLNTMAMLIFFDEIDTDRNGVIDAAELLHGLNKLGDNLEDKDVKEIVKIKGGGNPFLHILQFWRMMIWRKRFHEIDTDGKGFLNATNLKNFMNNLGHNMTNEDVIEIMNNLGHSMTNGDVIEIMNNLGHNMTNADVPAPAAPNSKDTLNFLEFLKMMMLHRIFQYTDKDKDGKISTLDLKNCYPSIPDKQWEEYWPYDNVVKVNFKTFLIGTIKNL